MCKKLTWHSVGLVDVDWGGGIWGLRRQGDNPPGFSRENIKREELGSRFLSIFHYRNKNNFDLKAKEKRKARGAKMKSFPGKWELVTSSWSFVVRPFPERTL